MNTEIDRRHLLHSAAAMTVGAAVGTVSSGCATPAGAGGIKTPFEVPDTYVPVAGTDLIFPVRRIHCIGRNYAAHAREMGSDPTRESPFFFQKPTDAIQNITPGTVADHPYPTLTKNDHYEVELVAALHRGGRGIPVASAQDPRYACALGLDMTRRDLQRPSGDEKKPWEIGKSFDRFAPIGPLHLASRTGPFENGSIWLKVNRQTKQESDLRNMIWGVAEQISRVSQAFELQPGDVIACHIDGRPDLSMRSSRKNRIGAKRFSCRVRRQRRPARLDAPPLSLGRQYRGRPSTSHDVRLISTDRMAR